MKLSAALVINGEAEGLLAFKTEIENLVVSRGLRLIYVKTSPRRMFVIEDDIQNGSGQGVRI